MRPLLIAITFLVVTALAAVFVVHWLVPPETHIAATSAPAKPSAPPRTTTPDLPSVGEPVIGEVVRVESPPPATGPEDEHEAKVRTRCQELMDLAMMDDQASLKKIWQELRNSDKDIRAGALEAVVQFGDRSKVQALRELADATEDAEEKAKIIAAADQLALPPMNLTPGAVQVDTPLPPQTKGY